MLLLFPIHAPVIERVEYQQRHANVLRRALVRHFGTLADACGWMKVKPSNFNSALEGDRGLPAGFLSLPPACLGWYGFYLVEEFGIPAEIKRGFRLMFSLMGTRRMAKARLARKEQAA